MPQITDYKFLRGLALNSNPLYGEIGKDIYGGPRSACQIADDCVLIKQHMMGNRRGFSYFTSSTTALVDAMFEYESYLIQHQSDNTLWRGDNSSGTRTQYTGTFIPPSPYRMDATVSRGSLFFTATSGVQKLDKLTGTPTRAGLTKGLDVRVSTTGSGAGFMNGYSKAAYRITWLRTDANGQQVRSDVSARTIVTNNTRVSVTSLTQTAGTATATTASAHGFTTGQTILIAGATQAAYNGAVTITVTSSTTFTYTVSGSPTSPATGTITAELQLNTSVAFTVPWDVAAGDSYEIWRTATVDASNADPGDTCYLVSRTTNAASAGATVTYTDTMSDNILTGQTALYTNATQEGATQGNARPPVCTTLTTYQDYTIYANTAIDHQLTLEMLATINFVAGSSKITIAETTGGSPRTYTFNTSENVGTQTAQIYTGGVSNAANIEATTRSLCHVINGDSSGSWYAEYTSGTNDNPGIFRIWARSPLTGAFCVTASDSTTGNQFTPALPTSGTSVASSNDARVNRLFYSKYQQPDHVPIVNWIDIGRLDQPILRVLAVRDACYVLKSDGVWFLSGLSAPFTLAELDSNCFCIAPASAVTLNNQIYMLANQGVVQISTSGVSVISFQIEPAIMTQALVLSNLSTVAFGVANETSRQYILWLPTVGGDTYATQAYVFHTFIQEWTRWTKPAAAGIALSSNFGLYISSGLENAILKQRMNGDNTDYADEALTITVTGQSGTTVTVTWSNTKFTPTAGVALSQGGSFAKVLSAKLVSGTSWNLTIDRTATFSNGSCTAYMPIYAHIRLSPNVCGEVGLSKNIYTAMFYLESNSVSQASIEVATNEAPSLSTFSLTRPVTGGWGSDAWGATGWGDVVNPVQSVPWNVDLPIPDMTGEAVIAGWLHNVAQEQFIIAQVAFSFDALAEYEDTPQ